MIFLLVFLTSFAISSTAIASEINETTSRKNRTQTMCRIATEDGLKPILLEKDNIMISDHIYVFAELTGDNIPELIAGSFDETFNSSNPIFKGNKKRSRNKHQYYFYSKSKDFVHPKGTKFSLATAMLVNDYNGDKKDDVFFVQHGPDYAPKIPQKNEIMLSSDAGFKVDYVPGPKSLWGGGTSGDIDRDGDVDVIVTPGPDNGIWLYENLGKGSFEPKRILSNIGRNYRVQLWDIDNDGYLDLFFDGHGTDLMVSWGGKNSAFSKPTTVLKTPYSQVQDFEFADVDNDGNLELIIMSSLKTKFTSKDMYYGGFELSYLKHSNREFGPSNTITKHVHQKGHYSWLKWISACDVLSDGKIDIVYEKLGEGNFFTEMNQEPFFNWTRADRIVWKNLGSGDFSILRFEDPNYFTDNTTYYKNTIKFFSRNGVAHKKYTPGMIYHKLDSNKGIFKEGLLYRRNGLTSRSPYAFSPIKIK